MDGAIEGVNDLLVVDDNPGDIRFIEEAFRESSLDLTVHTASTVDEAVDYLPRRGEHDDTAEPDVIFLDYHLTNKTSEDVVTAAKSIDSSIPVVMMTGSTAEIGSVDRSTPEADMCVEKRTEPEGYVEILHSVHSKI